MDFLLQLNWFAVGQIILIDLLLGGDNAIVIALACRNLPEHLRLKGVLWGTAGAIVIRIALISFAMSVLQMPWIKLVGGVLLLWIGVKLFADDDQGHDDIPANDRLFAAIRTIVLADMVMSIDNVVAVASAAEHAGGNQFALVVFGILVSIPIIVWGSTLVLKLMSQFPLIIALGAALLGYLGGAMIFTDAAVHPWLTAHWPRHDMHIPLLALQLNLPGLFGAVLVLGIGRIMSRKSH
ncbi:MAG: TerC family protein [Proteobacteria bacterium]|nr:TerC family protein [Pseudomonadota bacterium]